MASLSGLDPDFRPYAEALLKYAASMKVVLQVTSTRRSRAKQKRLYSSYTSGRAKYTVLPPGYSLHEIGLAMDAYTADTKALKRIGEAWRAAGGTWGGDADPVHFGAPRSWWPTPPW